MHLRELNVGCVGGGTGLPSLLGGSRPIPGSASMPSSRCSTAAAVGSAARRARRAAAGRRAQVRAGAGAQRTRGAQRAAGASADARAARPARRPHRRQPAAVDDGAATAATSSRPSTACARCSGARAACGRSPSSWRRSAPSTATARTTRGEVEVDAGQSRGQRCGASGSSPQVSIHPEVAEAIRCVRRGHHRPGKLLHQPAAAPSRARREGSAGRVRGPIILIANLLTEGRGMEGFTAAEAASLGGARDRPPRGRRDRQQRRPSADVLEELRGRAQGATRARVAAGVV